MALRLQLLNAVTATGAGSSNDVSGPFLAFPGVRVYTLHYSATAVISGGTLVTQALVASGNWFTIDSQTIAANTDKVVVLTGFYTNLRGNLTARTDGTYSSWVDVV